MDKRNKPQEGFEFHYKVNFNSAFGLSAQNCEFKPPCLCRSVITCSSPQNPLHCRSTPPPPLPTPLQDSCHILLPPLPLYWLRPKGSLGYHELPLIHGKWRSSFFLLFSVRCSCQSSLQVYRFQLDKLLRGLMLCGCGCMLLCLHASPAAVTRVLQQVWAQEILVCCSEAKDDCHVSGCSNNRPISMFDACDLGAACPCLHNVHYRAS